MENKRRRKRFEERHKHPQAKQYKNTHEGKINNNRQLKTQDEIFSPEATAEEQ
jgi:hypothetical protein